MKKRILALFLCLLMIIAVFAGCGSKADTRPDEEKIIGRWKWTFDAAKLILFEIEHQTGKDFHTSTKAEFLFYFDFYSNGEFSLCVDEASIERIEPDLIDVFRDIFKDKAFRADLAEYAAEEGMDLDTALNTAAYENAVAYSSYLKWLNDEDEEENAGFRRMQHLMQKNRAEEGRSAFQTGAPIQPALQALSWRRVQTRSGTQTGE